MCLDNHELFPISPLSVVSLLLLLVAGTEQSTNCSSPVVGLSSLSTPLEGGQRGVGEQCGVTHGATLNFQFRLLLLLLFTLRHARKYVNSSRPHCAPANTVYCSCQSTRPPSWANIHTPFQWLTRRVQSLSLNCCGMEWRTRRSFSSSSSDWETPIRRSRGGEGINVNGV